jgi:hypothetical protein
VAISSGVGPHYAILTVNGGQFLIEKGTVEWTGTKKSSTFSASIPIGLPGAEALISGLGDNVASIIVSARGQTATLITGEIDDTDFDYIDGMIHVSGRDKSAKLHEKLTAEKWVNKMPHEIITDLAGRAGLSTNTDQVALKMQRFMNGDHTKMTDNITYGNAIHKMCELMGARWSVKDSTLSVKIDPPSGAYSIFYSRDGNGDIVSDAIHLRVKRNIQAGKPQKVTVKSWHHHEKKTFTGENTVGGNGTPREFVYHLPNLKQDHVDQHAKAKSKAHSRHEITLSATLVGDPSIDPAEGVTLTGTSAFCGPYTIDSLEHSFGFDGYTMEMTAKGPMKGRS